MKNVKSFSMICFDIRIGIPSLFMNFLYKYAHCGRIINILFSLALNALTKIYYTFMNLCDQYKTSRWKVLEFQVTRLFFLILLPMSLQSLESCTHNGDFVLMIL